MRNHKTGLVVVLSVLALAWSGLAAGSEALVDMVRMKAAAVDRMHHKAEKALVTAAQDRAFVDLLRSHDDTERDHHRQRVEAVSLAVQRKFDVAEMCLINLAGEEKVRIVGDRVAHDLSIDEAAAPFFAPALQTPYREVYISPPYVSADVHRWVVAYVTPVVENHEVLGLLHYEHDLDAYRAVLIRGLENSRIRMIVVDQDDRVVMDSVTSGGPRAGVAAGQTEDRPRFGLGGLTLPELVAVADAGGTVADPRGRPHQIAYARVRGWTVLAVDAAP